MVANHHVGETVIRSPLNLTVFTLILAYMMVSNIKFRNFKKLSLKRDEISNTIILAIFLPFSLVVAKVVNPMFIFIYLCASYIAVGLVEEVIFYKKRKIHGVTLVNDSQQDLESDVTNR